MSLGFLTLDPAGGSIARSPIESSALAAGARLELRGGWSVAVRFGAVEDERSACGQTVGFADVSHIGKLELQGRAPELAARLPRLEAGLAARVDGVWWCPVTPRRVIALAAPGGTPPPRERLGEAPVSVVDLTSGLAAVLVAGPLALETVARFCALDLRGRVTPVGGFRPGCVAGTAGYVLRTEVDSLLLVTGWALGEHLWTVVADTAEQLGGRPVGFDAIRGRWPADA